MELDLITISFCHLIYVCFKFLIKLTTFSFIHKKKFTNKASQVLSKQKSQDYLQITPNKVKNGNYQHLPTQRKMEIQR